MLTLISDLRYAFRSLARTRGFTAAALLSLAIGLGANTSVFSVANALLWKPLPYRDARRLVILWNRSPGLGITEDWFSTAQYFDIKDGHPGFEQVAIAIGGNYTLTGDGEPERVGAIRVSSNLLPMLGASPVAGRLFRPEEDSPGHSPAALLTFGMWTRRYGRDPQIVGRSILVNGQPYQVVGILPAGFDLPREVLPTLYGTGQADILMPLPLGPEAARVRTHEDYNILAKLKAGVSVPEAQAEMQPLTARLRRDYPGVYPPNGGLTFSIVPLLDQAVGDVRRMLLVLLGSVGCVLLIACANVANLLLSRALVRRGEIGLRMALGAGRAHILRLLLAESLVLAAAGGVLGVLFSACAVRWLRAVGAGTVPRLPDIAMDGRVMLFALGLSLLSAVLCGLAPAWRVSRQDLSAALRRARRGSPAAKLLVVCELALSLVLLIGAGLLIRSYSRLLAVPPGFDPHNVLTFDLAMAGRKYADPHAVMATYRQLWDRLEHLPGATAAGGVSSIPLSNAFAWTPITIEGRVPPAGENFLNADERIVGGRYFQAMSIPLLRGRYFDDRDTPASPRAVIVDERMAREFWPGQDPVGKRIHIVQLQSADPWQTIVGVVGRVKQDSLDSDPRIAFYLAQNQSPVRSMTVTLRGRTALASLSSAVKQELRALDSDLPMYSVRTMEDRVAESLARRRFFEFLLSLFAGLALALAAIGIYGVMAYLVSQATREIGIRMAMGATNRTIVWFVLRQGMSLTLPGVAIGLAGAVGLTRLIRNLLFAVDAADPLTFVAISLLLGLTALIASYVPARRASRVDPLVSLRCE